MSDLTSDAADLAEAREIIELAIRRPLGKREWEDIYRGLPSVGRRHEIARSKARQRLESQT